MTHPTERLPLSNARIVTLALTGSTYWFVAALVVRATAASWVGDDGMTALVFVLIAAATLPVLLLGYRIAGIGRAHAASGATIMTGAAALLDGVALTWMPSLYGGDPAVILGGAAAILWGAGVALVLGMVLERGAR
jgi:hypothetical protein